MKSKKTIDRTILSVTLIGSLLLLNIVGLAFFGRLDLTRDKQFTLSDATLKTLHELKDPVTVRAYFSRDLPPPHSTQARYVRDLLDAYYTHGNGNFRFEFLDPAAEETSEDKEKKKEVKQDIFGRQIREATSMEQELQTLGIPPVQVRVNQDDKIEVKRAYMGLAIQYADKREAIPVISDTAGLEYDLTTLVRKVAREKNLKLGLVRGHEELSARKELGRAYGLLSEIYTIEDIDLTQLLPEDLDAMLVVGPRNAFSEAEKRTLDSYIVAGNSVAFLLGPIKPDLQTLQSEDNRSGLEDLLAFYGADIHPGLVLDAECATINVAQQQGFMRISQPVRYPFIPVPKNLDQHNLTRGLAQTAFPFMSPVQVKLPQHSPVQGQVLVHSSPESWVQNAPFNLDPMQRWEVPAQGDGSAVGPQPLLVTLTGPQSSFYQRSNDVASTGPEARLLVAGGATFITDPFLSKTNETLLLNLVDWLVRDDALLAVRSRGLASAGLRDVSDTHRNALKYANILGLPALFVGFGLVRWRRREMRRHNIVL